MCVCSRRFGRDAQQRGPPFPGGYDELIDQREDGGIGADTQGKGEYADAGEQGRFAQGTESVAQILDEGSHADVYRGGEERLAGNCPSCARMHKAEPYATGELPIRMPLANT